MPGTHLAAAKEKDTSVSIPGLTNAQTLAEKGQAVMDAAAEGTITPTEAATFMQSLVGLSRVIEADELEKRITALEGQQHES